MKMSRIRLLGDPLVLLNLVTGNIALHSLGVQDDDTHFLLAISMISDLPLL
jgi:hypothetical protein